MDVFGGGNLPDDGVGGAVPVEVVFVGGGGGAVPSEVVSLGGDGELRAVPIKVVCFDGLGGLAVSWQPPLQLVTTMVEVVKVV